MNDVGLPTKRVHRTVASNIRLLVCLLAVVVIYLLFNKDCNKKVEISSDSNAGRQVEPTSKLYGDKTEIERTQLLILTYFRGGSSFTGDILQQNKDVFYVFEPLRRIDRLIIRAKNKNATLKYLNGTSRKSESKEKEFLSTISSWFRCDISNINLACLMDSKFFKLSNSTREHAYCLRRSSIDMCVQELENRCVSSKFINIKTIRYSMKNVRWLLDQFPNMKVLHLIRDPRGMLQSHRKYRPKAIRSDIKSFTQSVVSWCKAILDDVKESELIYKMYPHKIQQVFYEDLAASTDHVARRLYRFSGMDYSSSAQKYVREMSGHSSSQHNCYLCTVVKNSTLASMSWRKRLPEVYRRAVDESCRDLYKQLGYIKLDTKEELGNLSVPSRHSWYRPINIMYQ